MHDNSNQYANLIAAAAAVAAAHDVISTFYFYLNGTLALGMCENIHEFRN